ncbi:bifunctional 5,10-methylenetetrahydrofolate dehydrogenase/5,10-methenyltetrahydrofolate cyclohydrolase [Candidatus Roizmanbacteria bacterium]|nr:bifunctional 5,10-methylenetetrahydrofolate dehydrogenase/5,10-methenyltetrahydrofolate cyclohydrolase [Candidatus Roizmanbacteria bacterium]
MKIPGRLIGQTIEEKLKVEVSELTKRGRTPRLVDILIGESSEQLSFCSMKEKVAHRLGIEFNLVVIKSIPSFESLAKMLKDYARDPANTGIIIQQPLPTHLQTDSIYNFLPPIKEIEGHKAKSLFYPPIGLGILTALKFAYGNQEISTDLLIDINTDKDALRKMLKHKKIVLIGRGPTGGALIGKTLSMLKINYLNINSKTDNPEQFYKNADIIIAAVGRKVITPEIINPGVGLLTVGLRREGDRLRGDYDEDEIKDIASYYSPTPGGVGPLDVLYLYKNLIESTRAQLDGIELTVKK